VSTYEPQEGVLAGRPPCRHCGAAFRLHRNPALDERPLEQHEPRHPCPTAYRPGSLEEAQRELVAAEASGDANRIFVARGEVQRLAGR
jgi:hypothetical protein